VILRTGFGGFAIIGRNCVAEQPFPGIVSMRFSI
jgi:hypothetical protein